MIPTEKSQESFFEKVQGQLNPTTVRYYYGPRIEKARPSLPYLVRVLQAHVVMLAETGIIPRSAAAAILKTLGNLAGAGPGALSLDPTLEDMYINLEKKLTTELGSEVAGYMPVARSRNDVEAAMWRIELREDVVRLTRAVTALALLMAERAGETAGYVMPGYTYGQQAQPTTAGHYLSAVCAELLRDAERFTDACRRLNLNPLGAAAFAGTGWPIDRHRTAELLGFDGLLENTLDAVATADYMLEALTATAITACTLGRLAEDLFRWCANEVGFATLSDDLIDSSTIMPQKRNPVIVATVRAQARVVAGEVSGLLSACSVGFEASRDVTLAEGNVREVLALVEGMTEITRAILGGVRFHPDRMAEALGVGFSNTTELADTLAREGRMPFRQAHQIVGTAVSSLSAAGKGPAELTYQFLNETCRSVTGRPLSVGEDLVRQSLDYRTGIERKTLPGGPAEGEVRRMVSRQKEKTAALRDRLRGMEERWQHAQALLEQAARDVSGPGTGGAAGQARA
ncbi:MAG: argininosuccinate lyase [Candidatus Methylomirabilales bacterium]